MFRRTRYQYYTNVNYRTCERCLAWHGVIRKDPREFPDHRDDCERAILPVPPRARKAYRDKGRRMRAAAEAEKARRKLFEEGLEMLCESPEQAIARFRQAAQTDLYVPDLERLAERHRGLLDRDSALREALRALFVKAFSDKFGWRRYERLPEVMRLRREKVGIERINELLR
jgi:hypothetical protein